MRADDLVSQAEIIDRLGISRQRFQVLANRPDFPEPIASPGGRRIWLWTAVEAWDKARKERHSSPGRQVDS